MLPQIVFGFPLSTENAELTTVTKILVHLHPFTDIFQVFFNEFINYYYSVLGSVITLNVSSFILLHYDA